MNETRPKLLPSFFDLLRREAEERGWYAIIPYALIASFAAGAVVAYLVPSDFWSNDRWDVSTAVYAGVLMFNGLMLALGWTAFTRIYELLFRGEFGAYLARTNLLNDYLVHINFMHSMKLVAVMFSGFGLLLVLINGVPLWLDRAILCFTIAMTAYAVKQAIDAVTAMNDLIWQAAYFELNRQPSERGNVVPAKRPGS